MREELQLQIALYHAGRFFLRNSLSTSAVFARNSPEVPYATASCDPVTHLRQNVITLEYCHIFAGITRHNRAIFFHPCGRRELQEGRALACQAPDASLNTCTGSLPAL